MNGFSESGPSTRFPTAGRGLLKHAGDNFVVCWGCGGKLKVPLELRVKLRDLLMSPQGSHISFRVVRCTSGFVVHRCSDE